MICYLVLLGSLCPPNRAAKVSHLDPCRPHHPPNLRREVPKNHVVSSGLCRRVPVSTCGRGRPSTLPALSQRLAPWSVERTCAEEGCAAPVLSQAMHCVEMAHSRAYTLTPEPCAWRYGRRKGMNGRRYDASHASNERKSWRCRTTLSTLRIISHIITLNHVLQVYTRSSARDIGPALLYSTVCNYN